MGFADILDNMIVKAGDAAAAQFGLFKDIAQWAAGDDNTSGGDVLKSAGHTITSVVPDYLEIMDTPRRIVDRGMSTAYQANFLAQRQAFREAGNKPADNFRVLGDLFSGDIWKQAAQRAEHFSAGQSFFETYQQQSFLGHDPTNMLAADENGPEFAKMRNSATYHLTTGFLDAFKSVTADPLVFGGKLAELARLRYIKAPIVPGMDIKTLMETPTTGLQRFNPRNLHNRTQSILEKSRNWTTTEQWINGVEGLDDATNGPAVAAALNKANRFVPDAERDADMKLILRITSGDLSAVDELATRRGDIMAMLANSRKSTLNAIMQVKLNTPNFSYQNSPHVVAWIKQQLDDLNDLQKLTDHRIGYLEHIDNDLFATTAHRTLRVTDATAAKAAKTQYTPFQQGIIQHSLWNIPVRVWHSATTTRPKGFINYDDPQSVNELRAMFDKVPDMDPALRNRFLTSYTEARYIGAKTSVVLAAKQAVFNHVAASMGFDKKVAATIFTDYMTSERGVGWWKYAREAGMTRYSAVIDPKTGLPADLTAGEDGVLNIAPQLKTELANDDPMLNVDALRHALRRNKNIYTGVANWLETTDRFSTRNNGARAVRAIGDFRYNMGEVGVDLGNWLRKWWIGATLLRLGYPIRVVADEQMRISAMLGTQAFALQNELAWSGVKAAARAGTEFITRQNRTYARTAYAQDQVLERELTNQITDLDARAKRLTRTQRHLKRLQGIQTQIQNPAAIPAHQKRIATMTKRAQSISSGQAVADVQNRIAQIQAKIATAQANKAPQADIDKLLQQARFQQKRLKNYQDPAYLKALHQKITLHQQNLQMLQLPNVNRKISARIRHHSGVLQTTQRDLQARPYLDAMLKHTQSRLATPTKDLMKVYGPPKAPGFAEGKLQVRGGEIDDALAGPNAELNKALVSSSAMHNIFHEAEKSNFASMARKGAGYVIVEPGTEGHMQAWLDALNHHIRQDPMAREFLNGSTVDDVLHKWFKTPEGKAHLADIGIIHKSDRDRWVNNVKMMVDQYVADPAWRQILLQRNVYPSELEGYAKAGNPLPAVHGPNIAENLGKGPASQFANNALNTAMKVLGQMPSDKLSRHPLYTAMYRQSAGDLAEQFMRDPNRVALGKSPDTLDEEDMRRIYKVAHAYALKMTKRTLYDVAAHTNLAHTLRFFAPFMGAWQETLGRWFQLTKDHPQLLGYAEQAWQAPNRMGLIVDKDGNPVPVSKSLNGDESIIVALPAWMGGPQYKNSPYGKVLKMAGEFVPYIRKNSFLLQLQGDPWWLPGFSPLIQIPVGWFADAHPSKAEFLDFIGATPFGSTRGAEAATPATYKRFASWLSSYGPERFQAGDIAKDTIMMYKQMKLDWELSGSTKPWDDDAMMREAKSRTRKLYLLRIATSGASPVTVSYRSKYQFYIDAFKVLKDRARTEGRPYSWAEDKFVQQYGESYFEFVQPISKVNVSVDPTAEGVAAFKKYRADISKYPDLAGGIVGPEGEGDYSEHAYAYETSRSFQEGNPATMRDYKSMRDSVRGGEAAVYWRKYIKLTQALDAIAVGRGEMSHRQDKQLMAIKNAQRDRWFQQSAAFEEDFNNRDSNWFDRNFEGVRKFANEKRVADRADIPTLRRYVAVRDAFQQILKDRKAAGGSANPTAESNHSLMVIYSTQVQRLAESNTAFDEHWMIPILDRDPMLVDTTAEAPGG